MVLKCYKENLCFFENDSDDACQMQCSGCSGAGFFLFSVHGEESLAVANESSVHFIARNG
jgi:hypothetical protein